MFLVLRGCHRFIGKITIVAGTSLHLAFGTSRRSYVLRGRNCKPVICRVFLVSRVSGFSMNSRVTPA
jgi:hypothetical protein